jgi:hypothetical protein
MLTTVDSNSAETEQKEIWTNHLKTATLQEE